METARVFVFFLCMAPLVMLIVAALSILANKVEKRKRAIDQR